MFYFWWGCLRFGYKHFPLADVFYFGGHLRLVSSCIWVNMVVKNVIMIKLGSESSGDRESKIHGNLPGAKEGEGSSNGGGSCNRCFFLLQCSCCCCVLVVFVSAGTVVCEVD